MEDGSVQPQEQPQPLRRIFVMRLVSGDEIISVCEEHPGGIVCINPMAIHTERIFQKDGWREFMYLEPYMTNIDNDKKVAIRPEQCIFFGPPDREVLGTFTEMMEHQVLNDKVNKEFAAMMKEAVSQHKAGARPFDEIFDFCAQDQMYTEKLRQLLNHLDAAARDIVSEAARDERKDRKKARKKKAKDEQANPGISRTPFNTRKLGFDPAANPGDPAAWSDNPLDYLDGATGQ